MNQVTLKISEAASSQMVLPILVLYNRTPETSETYRTLIASAHSASLNPDLIAVYDNSQIRQVRVAEEKYLFAYKHDPSNSGIAAAYNWALDIAKSHGFTWLLLLDQDTSLPVTFLASLYHTLNVYNTNKSVTAIVPTVTDRGVVISPKHVRFGRLAPLPKLLPQVAEYEVTAINSGVAIRVKFMASLGGFNPAYRLDCLDHWLFRQLYARGKRVALSDTVLEHNLSVSDYRNQVSLTRYRSILSAEVLFVTTQKRRAEIPVYVTRLLLRAVKQIVTYRRPDMAVLTCAMIAAMIFRCARFHNVERNEQY
jgi:GT2 family glycosyltransferase